MLTGNKNKNISYIPNKLNISRVFLQKPFYCSNMILFSHLNILLTMIPAFANNRLLFDTLLLFLSDTFMEKKTGK